MKTTPDVREVERCRRIGGHLGDRCCCHTKTCDLDIHYPTKEETRSDVSADEIVETAVGKIMGALPATLNSAEYRDIQIITRTTIETLLTSEAQKREEAVRAEQERIYDVIEDYFLSVNAIPDGKILCGYIRETIKNN